MDWLARLVVWLNGIANAVGSWVLAPIAVLPGWLSATIVAAATGVLLLIAYKYTSNQRAIKRVQDDIKAHLLALKLFKDSASVAVQAPHGLALLCAGQGYTGHTDKTVYVSGDLGATWKLAGHPASAGDDGVIAASAPGHLTIADRKSTRLNSSHRSISRMPSSA